ncbi:hypothetical protein D9757_013904 [Collybiopsis confluens]|uniref:FHA domain-containing protein n=1 Tax=Collybiopsis confluens TaxID=2823264 RepID=A0A8H5CNR2_9AGAR|nr:hypothetical protein D9757_013904 [Collybiopsis confluens]
MPAPTPFPSPFPALYLYPLNDSFIPKHISLVHNQHVKIGRQTNAKTTPGERNGYFDSKVLSRQHAEVWEESGKIFIKDVKSSNGTFINGERLSAEGVESDPYELKSDDIVEFGIDIVGEDNKTIVHHKVAARVVCIFSDQDAQMAARAEQHQLAQYSSSQQPSSFASSPSSSNNPQGSSSFNFNHSQTQSGGPQGSGGLGGGLGGVPGGGGGGGLGGGVGGGGPPRRPTSQLSQQGITGMGGMGAGMRAPGKSGLTFDHILTRLQGELQKSRETGAELHTLTNAMNEIHDTLGGGGGGASGNTNGNPSNAPPYPNPSNLPPVRPPQPSSPPPPASTTAAATGASAPGAPSPEGETSPSTTDPTSTSTTSSTSTSSPSILLTTLQTQLKDTQTSLSQHVDKIRFLEDALKEQEAIRREVGLLRDMMEAVQRRAGGALGEEEQQQQRHRQQSEQMKRRRQRPVKAKGKQKEVEVEAGSVDLIDDHEEHEPKGGFDIDIEDESVVVPGLEERDTDTSKAAEDEYMVNGVHDNDNGEEVEDEEDEDEEDDDDDDEDDARSVATAVPHELESVEEVDEDVEAEAEAEVEPETETEATQPRYQVHGRVAPSPADQDDEERLGIGKPRSPTKRSHPPSSSPSHYSHPNHINAFINGSGPNSNPSHIDPHISESEIQTQTLTNQLQTLSSQLESALALSSTLQAQHSEARDVIYALEGKVRVLERLVGVGVGIDSIAEGRVEQDEDGDRSAAKGETSTTTSTNAVHDDSSSSTSTSDPEDIDTSVENISASTSRENLPPSSLTTLLLEWKKTVQGQWSSVQEEWAQERQRLLRAREEWEGKRDEWEDRLRALDSSSSSSLQNQVSTTQTPPTQMDDTKFRLLDEKLASLDSSLRTVESRIGNVEGKVGDTVDGLRKLDRRVSLAYQTAPNGDLASKHRSSNIAGGGVVGSGHGLVTPPSPRSLSSDSAHSRSRSHSPRRKSRSSRGRTSTRKRSLSRGAETDDTEATLASEEGNGPNNSHAGPFGSLFDKMGGNKIFGSDGKYQQQQQQQNRNMITNSKEMTTATKTKNGLLSGGVSAGSPEGTLVDERTSASSSLHSITRTPLINPINSPLRSLAIRNWMEAPAVVLWRYVNEQANGMNMQAAFGVLVLSIAAAAVVWRVKPDSV